MNEGASFGAFFDSIRFSSLEEYQESIDSILGKLNGKYYDDPSSKSHGLIVGSVGRGTAVSGTSDLDMLFMLPLDVYKKFDRYESNGQSALLQEVKATLKERYPRSDIRGDGQAVVVNFTDRPYSIDLVPAFAQNDGSFKYPDTHGGGSWKRTNPVSEQEACAELFKETEDDALRLCNATRVWKNNIGLYFKGLLIDTLVANYCDSGIMPSGYYDLLIGFFSFLSNEDRDKSYWYALGSNQRISNDDGGAFVVKSKKTAQTLVEASSSAEREDALIEVFGRAFSKCVVDSSGSAPEKAWSKKFNYFPSEQFIEDMFAIDISCSMSIDCRVTQDGFRAHLLGEMLKRGLPLLRCKDLDFYISSENLPTGCDYYWKIRNCGEIAYRRKCVRGNIERGDGRWKEHADFVGPHYVECYAVKDGVCIARARIEVPIVSGLGPSAGRFSCSSICTLS